MSYNVHGQRDDVAALAAAVRTLDPDVVIVQEGPRRFRWRHKCAALAHRLGLVVGGGGLPALGNLLLTSLRVRVLESWCLRYPLTPGRHLRGAVFAHCAVARTRFTVAGTHLSTDAAERREQAVRFRRAVAAATGATGLIVVGADLNEEPGGAAWRAVADGLTDAAVAGGSGAGDATFPATNPQRRIDALFVDPRIRVLRCEVEDTAETRRASDHLPVVAELSLPS
ncbi:MAG: endonuclease [Actinobacteria bacterium]|nr:MAG: endonuclease [Actinomycetota bacterium]